MGTPSAESQFERYPDLRIIRTYLALENAEKRVVFEIVVSAKIVGRLSIAPQALGLPIGLDDLETARTFQIPGYVTRSLKAGLGPSSDTAQPVWLLLDRPSGFLPLIPFELLLQSEIGAPVLRLPHLPLRPFMPRESVDVAICFACPDQSENASQVAEGILRALPARGDKAFRVYVFGNRPTAEICRRVLATMPQIQAEVFSPESAPAGSEASTPSAGPSGAAPAPEIANVWLAWMWKTLGTRSLDMVQFVTHCLQLEEQGNLVFAHLDGAPPDAVLRANAREIGAFLDASGAWCLSLISPPSNRSDAGMRMLQDQIAWVRPGPICLFDWNQDPAGSGLQLANRFLLDRGDVPAPSSPGLTLLCHPEGATSSWVIAALAAFQVSKASLKVLSTFSPVAGLLGALLNRLDAETVKKQAERLRDSYTLSKTFKDQLQSKANTPNWIASAQRRLEQSVANIAAQESPAASQGAYEALSELTKTIQNTAKTSQDTSKNRLREFFRGRE